MDAKRILIIGCSNTDMVIKTQKFPSPGKTIRYSIAFANKAAAISVTRIGAQSSIPYRKEISN